MLRSGALVHTFRMSGGVTDVHALRPGASPNPQVTARTAHMSGGSSCSEMCLVIAHRLTHSRIYSSFCASGGAERQRVTARQNHERGDVRLSSEMDCPPGRARAAAAHTRRPSRGGRCATEPTCLCAALQMSVIHDITSMMSGTRRRARDRRHPIDWPSRLAPPDVWPDFDRTSGRFVTGPPPPLPDLSPTSDGPLFISLRNSYQAGCKDLFCFFPLFSIPAWPCECTTLYGRTLEKFCSEVMQAHNLQPRRHGKPQAHAQPG